jgi:hypothetical protein
MLGRSTGGREDCALALSIVLGRESGGTRSALRRTHIAQIRVAGQRAFAIVSQPGLRLGFYPLVQESGFWRLTALAVTPLG